jgi:hypothetical protein
MVLNGLDLCSGQTHAPKLQRSVTDGAVRRIPAFPASDDAQYQNLAGMQGQRCGEIRKHLIPTVRKGTRNQHEGAGDETHGNNLPSGSERWEHRLR